MKLIQKLTEYITEEIEDAKKYAEDALLQKENDPELARALYNISMQELEHMQTLHEQVSRLIENHRKEMGDPPASMMAVYNYLHEKQVRCAKEVRVMQAMYREG